MFNRRIVMAAIGGLVLSTSLAAPASATRPVKPPPAPPPERPPTSEEQAASDAKIAAAAAYLASVDSLGTDLVGLDCVPNGPEPTEAASGEAGSTAAVLAEGQGDATINACAPLQGFLAVEARDQIRGHYCGPAVGQVISNYAWAAGRGRNVFTQQQLAGWMGTDRFGGTSSWWMANGLEVATRGAPRRPAVWQWIVSPLRDNDGDGHVGDEMHGFIRANVSGSRMPLAVSLKPHNPGAEYRLTSWPKPVWSVGHWIAVYGWQHTYSNWNEAARTYYTDSSRDAGGSTGRFWDPTKHIAEMIKVHTAVFVW